MTKCIFIPVVGDPVFIKSEKKSGFTLDELQKMVGGNIEMVPLPGGKTLTINEEGMLTGLEVNRNASKLWNALYPLDKFPDNNAGVIVGNALLSGRNIEKAVNLF